MQRSIFLASFQLALVVALVGCDGPAGQTRPDPDTARQCGPAGFDAGADDDEVPGCAAGELCIEGRCYVACGGDGECGPREMCAPSGACVPTTLRDAGVPTDAGASDVCALVACTDSQVCHPVSGTCVQCNEDDPGHCDDVCDIARGQCATATPAQCAPCSRDEDCVVTDGFTGRCVSRSVQDVRERFCAVHCETGDDCPRGLTCDTALNACVPRLEIPCTSWFAGVRGKACLSDAECAALGAVDALYEGACEGAEPATEDGGLTTLGSCLRPCGTPDDCADGQECVGSMGFCRALSP